VLGVFGISIVVIPVIDGEGVILFTLLDPHFICGRLHGPQGSAKLKIKPFFSK